MQSVLQTLVFGLTTGGIIALNAVGLMLSYRVTRLINFAYGEFLTLSAYLTLWFSLKGLPLGLASGISILLIGFLGVLIADLFYEPLRYRKLFALLVTSLGIAFILQNSLRLLAGSHPLRFPTPYLEPWVVSNVVIPLEGLIVFGVAGILMAGVLLLLRHTSLGTQMRALAENQELAQVCGLRVHWIRRLTWFISALIGAIGGILLALIQVTVTPGMGFQFLLLIFTAVLLGGTGSPLGAFISGLLLGMVIEFAIFFLTPDYGYAITFLVLILILLFRPQGLFPQAR